MTCDDAMLGEIVDCAPALEDVVRIHDLDRSGGVAFNHSVSFELPHNATREAFV
jgi:hypothetical protein